MTWFGANRSTRVGSTGEDATADKGTADKYLVATGSVVFTEYAISAREALLQVKQRLLIGYYSQSNRHDPERLSRALLDAVADDRLNFVVMDGERTRLICGEYEGIFEEPVSRKLADSLRHLIPHALEMRRRQSEDICKKDNGVKEETPEVISMPDKREIMDRTA